MPAPAGDSGRGRERDAARLEEVDEQRQQPQLAARCRSDGRSSASTVDAGVFGADARCGCRSRDSMRGPGAHADRGVDRLGAGVEEIEGPDVDRAAREIDSGRRGGLDAHAQL